MCLFKNACIVTQLNAGHDTFQGETCPTSINYRIKILKINLNQIFKNQEFTSSEQFLKYINTRINRFIILLFGLITTKISGIQLKKIV